MMTLEALVHELPPELHSEVEDFVLFLLQKHTRQSAVHSLTPPTFDWAGGLVGTYDGTSVELQHDALRWREDLI